MAKPRPLKCHLAMMRPQRKVRSERKPRRRKRWLIIVATITLVLALWVGSAVWLALSARQHLQTARDLAQTTPRTSTTLINLCREANAAGVAARRLRLVVLPASPLLRRMGWVPRFGHTLAGVPALADVGAASADGVDALCHSFAPAFAALDQPASQRLAWAIRALQTTPPDWITLQTTLAALDNAWRTVPPTTWEGGMLVAYRDPAQRLDTLLPDARTALDLGAALWPAVPLMVGIEQPTTLLVVGQNPFELRPTGGFIGSLGTVTISNGQVLNVDYVNSGDLNIPAPAGSEFPQPYADYLRGSQWLLRDANWWADWSHSARTIETFWELNGGAPVDGVIGVDLYALQEVLATFDSLDVPGYGVITDTTSLEAIYTFYEPQGERANTNKAFLGTLLATTLNRVQGANATQLPLIGAAIQRAFAARHISVYLHDSVAQRAFAAQHWDGELRETAGDYVQIVDADLSYSDVQAFIDQQIGLVVELGANGAPLTNTLSITYTNRYDDWAGDQTRHQVYGYCYNVAGRQQERVAGCYGDYVRVYLPTSAAPLALDGADSPMEPRREASLSVVGFYVMLYPGQTRTITLSYRPQIAAAEHYDLLVQKQAGTLARPFALTVRSAHGATIAVQTDLWHDAEVGVQIRDDRLALTTPIPPLHPSNTSQRLAVQREWAHGWSLWQAGEDVAAVDHWRDTNTISAALDQVVALRWQGEIDAAQSLVAALDPHAADGRAEFLAGQMAEIGGEWAAARSAYERALQRSSTSQVTRLALALLDHRAGDDAAALARLRTMRDPLAALRRIEFDQRMAADYTAAEATNRLIIGLQPQDKLAWEQRYWMLRFGAAPPLNWSRIISLCHEALDTFPGSADWLARRAEAYQWLNDPVAALADWTQVTVISSTNHGAWYQRGVIHRSLNDLIGAQMAFQAATELDDEQHLEYYVALAEVYERLALLDQAKAMYEIAQRIAPDNESIRQTLARLGG